VTGDLRDRIAETLFDYDYKGTTFPDRGTAWASERALYLRIADALLPLFAEVETNARTEGKADGWDEAVQAVAWAQENGPDPLGYVGRNNPHRAALGDTTPPEWPCHVAYSEGGHDAHTYTDPAVGEPRRCRGYDSDAALGDTHGGEGMTGDLRDRARASMRKRLDDWLASTSEAYAEPPAGLNPSEAWREGVVSYLLDGPGALLPLFAEVETNARTEAAKAIERRRNEHWQRHLREHPHADARSCPGDYAAHDAYLDAAKIVRAALGDTPEAER
jgi:hypothetical protein